MRKFVFTLLFIFLTAFSFASEPLQFDLWPNGAPNDNHILEPELIKDHGNIYNITKAQIFVYLPQNNSGKAIISCPGGGYLYSSSLYEGHEFATWLNSLGVTLIVLNYRMPNGHSDVPISDILEAVRFVKSKSEDWKLQQVGVMGFSAGGHLASSAATKFTDRESRPDFQILFYPVITMKWLYTHKGTRFNLIGHEVNCEKVKQFSNELQIKQNSPRALIFHAKDDSAVPIKNSKLYVNALKEAGIPVTFEVLPYGGHGFGFKDSYDLKPYWQKVMADWLQSF